MHFVFPPPSIHAKFFLLLTRKDYAYVTTHPSVVQYTQI